MASEKLTAYIPANKPPLKGSEQKWMEEELKKLNLSIQSLIAAVKELQALHP